MHKGRIANDVGYRSQRMPRGEQDPAFDFADLKPLAALVSAGLLVRSGRACPGYVEDIHGDRKSRHTNQLRGGRCR
ncbi:MAG TPA: hypothetical protein VGH32_05730, partial [Pirellulales bacterium]